jgi:hypothetical protein
MVESATASKRPRIAVLANIYETHLHMQHIIDRILEGYNHGGVFHHPQLDVVSTFVEQRGEGDLLRERAQRHPAMKIYPTVWQALTRGTRKLDVDGIIYIGEQGVYPQNEKGQREYACYRFFEEIVDVFRASDRTVPVYVAKHLSYNWEWTKDMYDTSRRMGFRLMAGSSLPVAWRIPSIDMPLGARNPFDQPGLVDFDTTLAKTFPIHRLETSRPPLRT